MFRMLCNFGVCGVFGIVFRLDSMCLMIVVCGSIVLKKCVVWVFLIRMVGKFLMLRLLSWLVWVLMLI